MKTYFSLLALLVCSCSFAQHAKFASLTAGSHVLDVLSASDIYYFSKFTMGKVFFKDGSKSEAKLNYSSLLDEMQFINANGDTLALADEKNIQFIAIDNELFYYEKGYVRFLSGNSVIKLATSYVWRVGEKSKTNVYNSKSLASSTISLASYFIFGLSRDLVVNQDLELTKEEQFYFGDKNNHIVLAGKKNLLTLFPKEKSRIETYLKDNKVDFANKNDLEKIVNFLKQP